MTTTDDERSAVRVGVGSYIVVDGKLLLLRRRGAHGNGTWGPPGGHQDFGESPEQTAEREALEETDLQVRAVERLGFTDDQMPDEHKHYITVAVRCEVVAGVPRIMEPDKAAEMEWVTFDELQQ